MSNLKTDLRNAIVRVEFDTVNGEEKVMNCTLNRSLFDYESKGSGRVLPDNIVSVWDLDDSQFKSFRAENVISWSTINTLRG